MILDIVQIALPELGQKIQHKFSGAKVSISLCEGLALNCDASASWASCQLGLNRTFRIHMTLKNVNVEELCHSNPWLAES
jgi:hypothetical protein